MDIKDSYLHGTVGVVKSISVAADKLSYKLADVAGTTKTVTLPLATQSANGLLSKEDKTKLDNMIATKVANDLILKINSGTTEGTSLYTYNGSAAKTLDIKNGTGIGFATNAESLTIYNSGVRSIATGTTNGTISVNTNGTSADVAVKGLGSAAYTSSDTYVKWNNNSNAYYNIHQKSNITDGHVRVLFDDLNNQSVFGYGYNPTNETCYITNYKKGYSLVLGDNLSYRNKTIAYTDSNITGNAASADKLKTARKLWG
jgi:3-deoxy-D-manno-octulosonate 8-phosphate phosphatase KdsC-like HAD superfamily phosphatase